MENYKIFNNLVLGKMIHKESEICRRYKFLKLHILYPDQYFLPHKNRSPIRARVTQIIGSKYGRNVIIYLTPTLFRLCHRTFFSHGKCSKSQSIALQLKNKSNNVIKSSVQKKKIISIKLVCEILQDRTHTVEIQYIQTFKNAAEKITLNYYSIT